MRSPGADCSWLRVPRSQGPAESQKSVLRVEIRSLENELSKLNVPEEIQLEEFDGAVYNEDTLADFQDQLKLVEEKIDLEERELANIRSKIKDLVDEFLRAWRAVNPKKS